MNAQDFSDRLVVLSVDDEAAGLDEMRYLLEQSPSVRQAYTAADAADALRLLRTDNPDLQSYGGTGDCPVDLVLADVSMPGLTGMEFARVINAFRDPPALVFVTGHQENAVDAFQAGAVDYLLKPVHPDRLEQAFELVRNTLRMRRAARANPHSSWSNHAGALERPTKPNMVIEGQTVEPESQPVPEPEPAESDEYEVIPVELAGTTKLIPRREVRWVEAQGDYARLHTTDGSHLVRIPLAQLEERWAAAGFVRIHRSYLVALHQITELRMTSSGYSVVISGGTPAELPVSRRHTRALKDRLVGGRRNGAMPGPASQHQFEGDSGQDNAPSGPGAPRHPGEHGGRPDPGAPR